eukprot:s5043_g3.t1
MLNSLHCELIFNDLRDAQRRHRTAEVSKASNIATVAVCSGYRRSPLESIELQSADWLLLTGGLLKCRHTDEMQFALVVKSCANAVCFVQAVRVDPPSDLPDTIETYEIIGDGLVQETMQFFLDHGPIGITEPTVCRDRGLLFTVKKWKSVAEYLCEESIVHVPAGFLEKFCSAQPIGGKQKLKHHERVKQILQHFKYTDEYIDEVLSNIPEVLKTSSPPDAEVRPRAPAATLHVDAAAAGRFVRHHARRSPMGTEQALGAAKDLPLALERHYDLLGLRPGTPPPDVHAAYKRLGKTLGRQPGQEVEGSDRSLRGNL